MFRSTSTAAPARVITVAPGLWIFVAPKSMAPFRRAAEVTELEASCGNCDQKLHTWPFVPATSDDPAAVYVACDCLLMAIGERFELGDIVSRWKNFRRLANRVLAKVGPWGSTGAEKSE